MKKLLSFILLLLILPTILAIDISVEKETEQNLIIDGLDYPATFNLEITNNGQTDEFMLYNLLGFKMEPSQPFEIEKEETKEIKLIIYPRNNMQMRNFYTFEYYIRDSRDDEQAEKVVIKIIDLEDAFIVGTSNLDIDANSLDIYIQNKEDVDFENLNVKFSSRFFEFEETFDLKAEERKEFNIALNKEDFKKIIAGFYTVEAEVTKEDLTRTVEGVMKFVEKGIVETEERDTGFVVSTITVSKVNNGNTVASEQIVVEKNIISRLFTSFSPEPETVERQGWKFVYTWDQQLGPGDSLSVAVTTNWFYPLLMIALIVAIIVLVKRLSLTDVSLRKKVTFVKAKGGQFALKVTLFISSKKYVERVNIIDRLPALMKVYQKFGGEQPSRIDEGNRLIEWDFQKLEAGEVRTLSYVVYSKNVGVMGKFALPPATAIFQRDGQISESASNRAFFVTEQRSADDSDID